MCEPVSKCHPLPQFSLCELIKSVRVFECLLKNFYKRFGSCSRIALLPLLLPTYSFRRASLFSFYFKHFFFFPKRKQGTAGVAKFIFFSSHGAEENTFTEGGGLRACEQQLEQAPRPRRARRHGRSPGRTRGRPRPTGDRGGRPGRVGPRAGFTAEAAAVARVWRRRAGARRWKEGGRCHGNSGRRRPRHSEATGLPGRGGVSDADPGLQGDPPGGGGGLSILPHFPGSLSRAVT